MLSNRWAVPSGPSLSRGFIAGGSRGTTCVHLVMKSTRVSNQELVSVRCASRNFLEKAKSEKKLEDTFFHSHPSQLCLRVGPKQQPIALKSSTVYWPATKRAFFPVMQKIVHKIWHSLAGGGERYSAWILWRRSVSPGDESLFLSNTLSASDLADSAHCIPFDLSALGCVCMFAREGPWGFFSRHQLPWCAIFKVAPRFLRFQNKSKQWPDRALIFISTGKKQWVPVLCRRHRQRKKTWSLRSARTVTQLKRAHFRSAGHLK